PVDNAVLFDEKIDRMDQPLVSWQAYRLKQGETLPQVAAKYGMSVEMLKSVNGIGTGAKVPVGHTLLVPSQRPSEESANSLAHAVFTTVPSGRTVYYTVRRGESVPAIAARYGVSVQDLRRWNNLTQNNLVVGKRLRIASDVG